MFKLPKNLRGFTLIELLIVIAVLAILALGLLSAINPLEQIRKAQDSTKRTDAAELITAYDRYYATIQKSPWGLTAPDGLTPLSGTDVGILELVAKNELKSQFTSRTTLTSLYAKLDANTNLLMVCFAPTAAANKAGATKTSSGAAGCVATTTAPCYTCLPDSSAAPAAATPTPTPTTATTP